MKYFFLNMRSSPRASQKGFTLLEVMISLALFTIIGIATAKHLQQLKNTKDTAFNEIDLYNSIRTALSVMRFDISQAFHILYDDLGSENKQALIQDQEVAHTIFDGRKKQLIFTSLSHRVYYQNRKESEQTEISYFLQEEKDAHPSLMKRESKIIDEKPYEGGPVYTLLENVVDLQFQFWDEKEKKWLEDWNSDEGATRDKFPYAVKILLTVAGQRENELTVETQFKIAFPNNKPFLVKF